MTDIDKIPSKRNQTNDGKMETHLEKTMLFLAWVATVAGAASIGIQIVALSTQRQILEGLSFELLFLVAIMLGYKKIFGLWIWQSKK